MSKEKDEAKEKEETAEQEAAEEKPEGGPEETAEEDNKPEENIDAEEKAGAVPKPEDLDKPLEKMTVKDLRELAKDMPGITGVHGMKKDELIVAIKEVMGIKDEPVKKADASAGEIKGKIKALKAQRQAALEAKDKKMATIYKRRISRLKKKSRRKAA